MTVNGQPRINATKELLDRQPPRDRAAELSVVGLVLLNSDRLDGQKIFDTHFADDGIRAVFNAIRKLRHDREPVDVEHVVARLKAAGVYETIGGGALFGELYEHAQMPSQFSAYSARLLDLHNRRAALHAATTIIRSVHSNQPTCELLSDAAAQFDIYADESRELLTYPTMTIAELLASEDNTEYFIDNVLAKGQPCILGGPAKCLKTSVLTDLCVSLATRRKFLGVHDVPQAVRVCVMSGESGQDASRTCFRSVLEAKGCDPKDMDNIFWSSAVPRIGTIEHQVAMRHYLREYQPEVLAIDPAYLALECDSPENIFRQGALLAELNDLCVSAGATLLLVHHTKGRAECRPTTLDDLSWAGFREFFRQWILVSRRREYDIGSGLHELRIDTGGSARHSWSGAVTIDEGPFNEPRWYVTVQGVSESREADTACAERRKEQARAAKRQRDHDKLLQAAAHYVEGETLTQLRAHAGLSSAAARDALSETLRGGEMLPCQVTKNGRPENGFKLANN